MLQTVLRGLPGGAREAIKKSALYPIYSGARSVLNVVAQAAGDVFLPLFASNRIASSLYYFLFSRKFGREHQAVLVGQVRYRRAIRASQESSYLLRRNVHRLEKGLSMRPRRSTFATEFIGETVGAYEQVIGSARNSVCASEELSWAFQVLTEYFSVASGHPSIESNRAKFAALPAPLLRDAFDLPGLEKRVPFPRSASPDSVISYSDFLALTQRRRSVRWFQDRPADRELVDKAIDAARFSPSACNRLPYSFIVLDDYALVQKVAAMAGGTGGYRKSIQTLVVVVGHLSAYFDERDRHLIYIDSSLACMSFMLAAESLGLSTCAINWSDVEKREKAISQLLHLRVDDRPIMLIAVGYADEAGIIPYSSKKSVAEIRSYNFENR